MSMKPDILCEACEEFFKSGHGHICWCPDCSVPHNIQHQRYKGKSIST